MVKVEAGGPACFSTVTVAAQHCAEVPGDGQPKDGAARK